MRYSNADIYKLLRASDKPLTCAEIYEALDLPMKDHLEMAMLCARLRGMVSRLKLPIKAVNHPTKKFKGRELLAYIAIVQGVPHESN